MEYNSITRLIFLLFITIVAVCFMYMNTKEEFEEQKLPKEKVELEKIIVDLYAEIYVNDPRRSAPTKSAIDFYYEYAKQRDLTREQLKDIIAASNDALAYSFVNTGITQEMMNTAFGTEDDVIEIYNSILLRNPDDVELYNYAKLLKEDSTFTKDKLKEIIFSSEEYARMEKTQTNSAYAFQMGGVTDRQISMIVRKLYEDVSGNKELDEDTFRFLKKKFREFNLDEKVMAEFIKKYISNEEFNKNLVLQERMQTARMQRADNASMVTKAELERYQDQMEKIQQEYEAKLKNMSTHLANGKPVAAVQNPNKQVIEILLKTTADDANGNYLNSQNVLDVIKEEANAVFDKKKACAINSSLLSDATALQDAINNRNEDDLKSACVRNRKYINADENMVLRPDQKWSVPQKRPPVCVGTKNDYQPLMEQTSLIGTLLPEANKTKVGSVLPLFPPS